MDSTQAALALALTTAAGAGVADFLAARAARRLSSTRVAAWAQSIGLVVCIASVAVTGGGEVSLRDASLSALAGVAIAVGITALYRCLAIGPIGVTAPVAAVSGAAVPVLAAAVFGEVLRGGQYAGLALGLMAVPLLAHARDDGARTSRNAQGILIALLAGLGIGGFTIFLHATGPGAGLWPMAIARFVAALALWIAVAREPSPGPAAGSAWSMLLPCGLLDGAAMVAFLMALRGGELSIVSVLAAFYPAATIILAMLIDGEKLQRVQWAGLFAAAFAIALII